MSQGGHSEQLLFFALFYQSTPSCLKVGGGWRRRLYTLWRRLYSFVEEVIHPVEEVIHTLVIIVSAQSKELGFLVFQTWSDLRVRIWCLLGQGIGELDSGLTTND